MWGFGGIKRFIMIYSVENKRSGEFHFCSGYDGIVRAFPVLRKKQETIKNRFRELKKEKKLISFSEWGFDFKAANQII